MLARKETIEPNLITSYLPNLWLVLKYCSLLVIVSKSNGGGDHPIPAVVRGSVATGVAGTVVSAPIVYDNTVPTYMYNRVVFQTSTFLSYSFAPMIGWLAE